MVSEVCRWPTVRNPQAMAYELRKRRARTREAVLDRALGKDSGAPVGGMARSERGPGVPLPPVTTTLAYPIFGDFRPHSHDAPVGSSLLTDFACISLEQISSQIWPDFILHLYFLHILLLPVSFVGMLLSELGLRVQ